MPGAWATGGGCELGSNVVEVVVVLAGARDVGFDMVGVARWGVLCVLWGMVVSSLMVGNTLGWLGLGCWLCGCFGLPVCQCCVVPGELEGGVLLGR